MAKKRKSQKNQTTLLVLFVAILLSVLTICTLFMPLIKTNDSFIKDSLTGAQIVEVAFATKYDSDMTASQNSMFYTKDSDDGFSTGVFCWAYFVLLIVAAVVLVFSALKLIGIKFDLIGVIAGAVLVILAIVVFIFAFIACGKFNIADWTAAVGAYFAFFGGLLGGAAAVYGAKK